MTGPTSSAGPQVMLRPVASPLPLGFLALVLATVAFAAVQLGWVAPTGARAAALTALAATAPLQLLASVVAVLGRDVAACTGMGVLAGTWATVGLATLGSPPGTTTPELGVFLLTAGVCMLVPAAAAIGKAAGATVMTVAGIRFAVTGVYELTGSAAWKAAAGWTGLLLGLVALYAALALALEGSLARTVLPVGRRGRAALSGEPGIRPQL
jgi:succinate-acetate transporter protein